ncbi:helix-turn-helix domain-containing protein [uncultured Chitinophaga sp.]|jgi:AraC-type DNA-binding domain-containing proteins|uniref:AraC family transcriptional regulator n=1 Tax=uncultured Chitinophaga sp. TaxID=339340 RepID=UPI002632F9A2|nr:helix-turn-helix domain-containing protein [uncultured Chitinophaga sp.]
MSFELHIRNMVCPRCVKTVRTVLEREGASVVDVQLGKAVLARQPDTARLEVIANALQQEGLPLVDDKKQQLAEAVKNIIVTAIHHSPLNEMKENFSTLLASRLQKDYHYLSTLFSELEQITIEQYIIRQKIERVKELLVYDELNLSEIAWQLGYSSVAHLSGQFKKVTGLTPSQFKQLKEHKRRPLDTI